MTCSAKQSVKVVSAHIRFSARSRRGVKNIVKESSSGRAAIWPGSLFACDDPVIAICESCDEFQLNRRFAGCRLIPATCASSTDFFQAVAARNCPAGKLDHLKG